MSLTHRETCSTISENVLTLCSAGAMVKVPHFSSRKDFKWSGLILRNKADNQVETIWKAVLGRMGLQARGTAGVDSASTGGTWDISNADRLGKSEIELVNIFIEGYLVSLFLLVNPLFRCCANHSMGAGSRKGWKYRGWSCWNWPTKNCHYWGISSQLIMIRTF